MMCRPIHRTVIVLIGLLVVLTTHVRAEDSSRDTIIQGVRDDIRRKIQEGNERPADNAEQLARQQQPAAPSEQGSPKQEPAKQDQPKPEPAK